MIYWEDMDCKTVRIFAYSSARGARAGSQTKGLKRS